MVIRDNGVSTYFASDIGYLLSKFERGFRTCAVHLRRRSSRLHRAPESGSQRTRLGSNPKSKSSWCSSPFFTRGGERVQMSTRAGSFVTLRELREEVGNDAARYLLCDALATTSIWISTSTWPKAIRKKTPSITSSTRSPARPACSVNCSENATGAITTARPIANRELMDSDAEHRTARRTDALSGSRSNRRPNNRGPQILANYLRETANAFHSFYENCDILSEDEAIRQRPPGAVQSDRTGSEQRSCNCSVCRHRSACNGEAWQDTGPTPRAAKGTPGLGVAVGRIADWRSWLISAISNI